MSFNTKFSENFNCVLLYTQSHFSWLNCIMWHTACCKMWHTAHSQTPIIMYFHKVYLVLAVSIPTSLPTYSRSIEGYHRLSSLNHLSPPDTLAYAAPATWAVSREGWLGALDFVLWVPGPRYAMCQWRSIPWKWWNISWHIQTQSTAVYSYIYVYV